MKDIFHIHSLVMKDILPINKTGQIRPGPIYIVDIDKKREVVRYVGPSQRLVSKLLKNLLDWLNLNIKLLHPVLIAGIVHYEFVSIHPFSDGNGRVTRLLVKLLLDSLGYDFRGSLVLDTYYLQNTLRYYASLNQAGKYLQQTKSDLTPWITYFVQGFMDVVKDLNRKISLINSSKRTEVLRLTENEIEILDYVNQFGAINLQDAKIILRIPNRSIQRLLHSLVKKGLLVKIDQGKNTRYNMKS
jgi:Fic family protein